MRLLDDHDKKLVPKMSTTMKQIFEHHFLPNWSGSAYYSDLYASTSVFDRIANLHRSIRIKVFPLPQSCHQEEEIPHIDHEDVYFQYWRPFHDEVFGKRLKKSKEQDPIPSTIDHIRWHPYLGSRLLNALVKYLYDLINPEFGMDGISDTPVCQESFAPYIVECLPYAETTPQNLDSLRAIAYLFPNARLKWNLPVEFWTLSVEFLKVSSSVPIQYIKLTIEE